MDGHRTANGIACVDIAQNKMVLERYPSDNWVIRENCHWLPTGDDITQEPQVQKTTKLNPFVLHYVVKDAFYVKRERPSITSGLYNKKPNLL